MKWHDRCRVVRMRVYSHRFPFSIGKVFQSRCTLRLYVTCLVTVVTPSLVVRFHSFFVSLPMLLSSASLLLPLSLLSVYCCVLVISSMSSRVCVQLAILALFRMGCALTRTFSISSTVAPVLVSSLSLRQLTLVHESFGRCRLLSVRRLRVGNTTRSSRVQQVLAPIPSRTVSRPRIPRSRLHWDTCSVLILSLSSRVCSTSVW